MYLYKFLYLIKVFYLAKHYLHIKAVYLMKLHFDIKVLRPLRAASFPRTIRARVALRLLCRLL